jgi:ferrous iron transport protein B
MEWIESGCSVLAKGVSHVLPEGLLRSLINDGIIGGVGSVVVFLPQILILFFFILVLEGTGYMMRAAFLLDRFMARVGLQGRSFVPLLSSFACAIPGVMATRTIKNPRDRLLTILVAPLMTCSARLPVYVLLIGAFIPNTRVFGTLRLQGVVMFGLFLVGILSAMAVAFVARLTVLPGPRSSLIMELPAYKWPNPRYVLIGLIMRSKVFLRKAGTLILAVSVILWILSTFPQAPADWDEPAITYSMAGRIGRAVEPAIAPLGFDWRIGTGLIPGFAAREVMVGALGAVFSVENADDESTGFGLLQGQVATVWGLPTGLALLVWYIFAPQCLATFAVVRRETNSWKWTGFMFGYMLGLAYLGALLTFTLARLFT